MREAAWVVFDGTEPDSSVIGLAASLEDVVLLIKNTVILDQSTLLIELSFPNAGTVRAKAQDLYAEYGVDASPRAWAIAKETIRGSS